MRYRADSRTYRLSQTAILLACACVLAYAESLLFPPLPIPGLRVGLANIAVVIALARLGTVSAAWVSFGRVFVVGLATGALVGPQGLMALAGAACSLFVMAGLRSAGSRFSVVGWSVAGAAAHVMGQLFVAAFLVGSSAVMALSPFSLLMSLPTGLAVGFAARLLLPRISRPVVSVA